MVCTGGNWVNGNLNPNNSHYREGDSVPFRMTDGRIQHHRSSHLVIEYDNTQERGSRLRLPDVL